MKITQFTAASISSSTAYTVHLYDSLTFTGKTSLLFLENFFFEFGIVGRELIL